MFLSITSAFKQIQCQNFPEKYQQNKLYFKLKWSYIFQRANKDGYSS